MAFYDQVLESLRGHTLRSGALGSDYHDSVILGALKPAFVIRAQNVSNYMDSSVGKSDWTNATYPNVAPPLEQMWFEWKITGVKGINGPCDIGIYVHSTDIKLNHDWWSEWDSSFGNRIPNDQADLRGHWEKARSARWVCFSMVFLNFPGGSSPLMYVGPDSDLLTNYFWFVMGDGTFMDGGFRPIRQYGRDPRSVSGGLEAEVNSIKSFFYVVFMTMSFMHCKNVSVVRGPEHPEALQKSRIKKGKSPLVRWSTVNIEPMKKIIASETGAHSRLTPAALHICRGHFKKFDEKPLFGKVKGTFWWPMFVRGSKESGIVNKDYEVDPGPGP